MKELYDWIFQNSIDIRPIADRIYKIEKINDIMLHGLSQIAAGMMTDRRMVEVARETLANASNVKVTK